MAKYPFFGKKGRPSAMEVDICKKINEGLNSKTFTQSELDKLLNSDGYPMTQEELETMYTILTGDSATGEVPPSENDGIEERIDESNSSEEHSNFDDSDYPTENYNDEGEFIDNSQKNRPQIKNSEAINFDPFKDPVIEREYTKGIHSNSSDNDNESVDSEQEKNREGVQFDENDTSQPKYDTESINSTNDITDAEFTEVEDDIPEPEWNNTSDASIDENDEGLDNNEEGAEKLGGDNLEDLSPAQKRKSAEKTAEAIMQLYCKFAPVPFTLWSSFSEKKITKMILEGKIDPNMPLENGVTVQDYIDGANEQAKEIFTVTDEAKEEIKDPLIDVLLEQELALTPTQRLLMAVGSHVVTMGFSAFQLAQNNKQALETFEKFHANMKSDRETVRPSQSPRQEETVPFTEEFTKHDADSVSDIIEEISNDDGILSTEHDPDVSQEDTIED